VRTQFFISAHTLVFGFLFCNITGFVLQIQILFYNIYYLKIRRIIVFRYDVK